MGSLRDYLKILCLHLKISNLKQYLLTLFILVLFIAANSGLFLASHSVAVFVILKNISKPLSPLQTLRKYHGFFKIEREFIDQSPPFTYPAFQSHHPFGICKFAAFIGDFCSLKAWATAFMNSQNP